MSLLNLSRCIDRCNAALGWLASLAILLACAVSVVNALSRYLLDWSSNWALELQWYLFGAAVMLGASAALAENAHVRVDIIYGALSHKAQLWVDIFGLLLFLLPACCLFAWLSWNTLFLPSWLIGEYSNNVGGLPRYLIKFILPLGFSLLVLQGLSELIKRCAALRGHFSVDTHYQRPES